MKSLKLFLAALGLSFLSVSVLAAGGHDHGDSRVMIELQSSSQVSAGTTQLQFKLHDMNSHSYLTSDDLNITHEKVLHFLAYDPGLKEFQHVHPEFDGKNWVVELDFSVNGNYFLWAQGEVAADSTEFSALERLQVIDGSSAWPAPSLTDVRTGEDSGSVATLSGEKLKAGKMVMLTLEFTKVDGSQANVTPYLGAFAHVIAVPEDGGSLLHVHPMDGGAPNEGMLHATFPKAGSYRLWVQFNDDGILKTVPLSVTVN